METPAQPDVNEATAQVAAAQNSEAKEPTDQDLAKPSQLATVEVDPKEMDEVFTEMAQNSPELTHSLNALNEARKAPADKLTQKTRESQETTDPSSKALISVRDYTQTTPVLDINPIEDLMEFQFQDASEAQDSLAQELLVQAPAPAPAQTPAPAQIPAWAQETIPALAQPPVVAQTPVMAQTPAPASIPAWAQETPAQSFTPIEAPVLAQGTAPIQTSVPILPSAPIQTTAPTETPELVQTSALVQTSTPVGSPALTQSLPAPVEGLEQASVNQAAGSLAPLPDPTSTPVSPKEISEDLDQNPLAAIMGLTPSEKPNENESETARESVENPGKAAGIPAGSSTENVMETPAETSTETPAGTPTVSSTEAPAGSLAGSPVGSSAESPTGTSFEIPGETASETPKQIAESPFSHHPTRIKKPDRTPVEAPTEKETRAPIQKEEYSLDVYRVNLRKALASFQIETGLKVVASLDVQGTVSCKSKNSDPEVLLASLLADTQFKFVRSGSFVYIAPANQLTNLPTPLEKTETQVFTPKYVSLEELELVFKSNLSQFGTCEVTRNSAGEKGLSVTDWVLSLDQLEKIQQIVDVPAPEEQINAFVFQRELDGTFKALEL
ncbi:MAG: hypothetical protein K6C40_09715, partial [Thermoguttaceae bacterium]|nr:hypothetical protein [Thermoguttaceae bacterium]